MELNHTERQQILTIYHACNKSLGMVEGIQSAEELAANELVMQGLVLNMVLISDTDKAMSQATKEKLSGISWDKIAAHGQESVHPFTLVDATWIWNIITDKMSLLQQQMEQIMPLLYPA